MLSDWFLLGAGLYGPTQQLDDTKGAIRSGAWPVHAQKIAC